MKLEFIAEIGLNYNGNLSLAYELIRQAKYSGADIVKFQLGWKSGKGEINYIDKDILADLKKWADYFEIELMFSVITEEAYKLIRGFDFQRYKIASRTVRDNIDLVKNVVNKGKFTYISLGMWDEAEFPLKSAENIFYLWCKSKYPATPWDLIGMPKLFDKKSFYGYSDHSIGIDAALIAISRGAMIIEKHFTLNKSDPTIRDHVLSATPDEFLSLTRLGREISRKIKLGI